MRVEFNGNSYQVTERIGDSVCNGCIASNIMNECPIDSKRHCILPFNKVYIQGSFSQLFKL